MKVTNQAVESDILNWYSDLNVRVREKVKTSTRVSPRTKVREVRDLFSVDVSTGDVYVALVEDEDVAIGYLTHENGHRSAFPASSYGAIAFTSAVRSLVPNASEQEVFYASNVVADVFSDFMLLKQGLGENLTKRVPHFLRMANPEGVGMTFKVLMYKAIEIATKKNQQHISWSDIEESAEWLITQKQVERDELREALHLASEFVRHADSLIDTHGCWKITQFLLDPFRVTSAPQLSFLSRIASKIVILDKKLTRQQSTSGGKPSEQSDQGGNSSEDRNDSQTKSGGVSQGRDEAEREKSLRKTGGKEGDKNDITPEDNDIQISKVDVTDIQKAMNLMVNGFGVDLGTSGVMIEKTYSDSVRNAVKRVLDKLRITCAMNDFKSYKPSGFTKKTGDVWTHPHGEPDEDSIMVERKLFWKVAYHTPNPRGSLTVSPAKAPESVIIVQDESGSTMDYFGGTNIISVEAFVSLLVMSALKYRGGAKDFKIIKFSDECKLVYSGKDEVEAGIRVLIPYERSGGGTNIINAVSEALKMAKKQDGLIIVTDAAIGEVESERIGSMLRTAVDSRNVGLVVFIVVNPKEEPSLTSLRKSLSGRNCVIEHIKSAEDLEIVSGSIMNHILRTYT